MGEAKRRGPLEKRYNEAVLERATELQALAYERYVAETKAKIPKIAFKLVRQFALGFAFFSPDMGGGCATLSLACFELAVWSRGGRWFGFGNHWRA